MLVKFLVLVQLVCVGMYKWRPYWFLSWYSKYVTYINVTFSLRKLHSCRFSPRYRIWKKYRWGGTYLIQVGKYLNLPTEKRKEYFWLKWRKKSNCICLYLPLPIFIQKITLRPLLPFFSVPYVSNRHAAPPTWMRPLVGCLELLSTYLNTFLLGPKKNFYKSLSFISHYHFVF